MSQFPVEPSRNTTCVIWGHLAHWSYSQDAAFEGAILNTSTACATESGNIEARNELGELGELFEGHSRRGKYSTSVDLGSVSTESVLCVPKR
jgi:hypothetical protein